MPPKDTLKYYMNQEYKALKKKAQKSGQLFTDPEFPPFYKSLLTSQIPIPNVAWKRPRDICPNPRLFVDGHDSGDVRQGSLGNCWFVAACSSLALYKEIFQSVIPDAQEQELDKNYAGIFRFHIWRYGEWMEIVVDDLLPTINGELVFVHSQSQNEFWSALLEKAYAKLFGSYEALDGGELSEALEDFTGGVSENYNLLSLDVANRLDEQEELFKHLEKDSSRMSLMAASIPAHSKDEMEAPTNMGLVKGHAYGITAVRALHLEGTGLFMHIGRKEIRMIRLRNPWGKGEWKGAFSDGSPEWEMISDSDRRKVCLDFDDDGEFWMTFEDFVENFVNVAVCRVVNTRFFSLRKTWHEGLQHGEWRQNSAGGCIHHHETFLTNPQYRFDIKEDDNEIMVQLSQKSTRTSAHGAINEVIGVTILKCEVNRECRIHNLNLFTRVDTVTCNTRSVFLRKKLQQGRYVLIPSTFEPGKVMDFLMRIYTDNPNDLQPLTLDTPPEGSWGCCSSPPKMITQVKVLGALELQKQDVHGGGNPYCVITCEGEKVTTPVRKDNLSPEWDTWAVFYRKKPEKPIKFQIWNNHVTTDKHMGTFMFTDTAIIGERRFDCPLVDETDSQNVPGLLDIHITQNTSMMAI